LLFNNFCYTFPAVQSNVPGDRLSFIERRKVRTP
jgi:hypothetical protein